MSADPWGNDPDRTTRRETWGQIEEAAIGLANNHPPRITYQPPPERHLNPWLVTGLLAASLLVAALALIGAAS